MLINRYLYKPLSLPNVIYLRLIVDYLGLLVSNRALDRFDGGLLEFIGTKLGCVRV